jgi:hypothetical protein
MPRFRRRALLLLLLPARVLAGSASASAAREGAAQTCGLSIRLVALRLVSSTGAPIAGAGMRVWRVGTGQELQGAGPMGGQGDYRILEDGDLPDLAPAGEPFDVEFRQGDRVKRVRLRIGLDATRCHVTLLDGPARVVW